MSLTRREFITSFIGLGALPACCASAGSLPPEGLFAVAGKIITGNSSPSLINHAVLVRDGYIEGVVPTCEVSDRPILALDNASVIPGVINAHCHQSYTPQERREKWLKHGVTTIADVGAPVNALKTLADSPPGTTASALFSGPMLTPPGGYPLPVHDSQYAMVINSPASAKDAVTQLADQGSTLIKISFEPGVGPHPWPMFDPQTAGAICDAARRRGLIVRCHVEDLSGLEPALNAGVHTIEHVPHRWYNKGRVRSVLTPSQKPMERYLRLLERMTREDITLTPTLDVLSRSPWRGAPLLEPVRAFHGMGGRIAVGNDFPYKRINAGMPLREMHLLGKAGLSSLEILRAATHGSAMACGLTDRGQLVPGMAADMVIAKGDLSAGLEGLSAPMHIIKDGRFIR